MFTQQASTITQPISSEISAPSGVSPSGVYINHNWLAQAADVPQMKEKEVTHCIDSLLNDIIHKPHVVNSRFRSKSKKVSTIITDTDDYTIPSKSVIDEVKQQQNIISSSKDNSNTLKKLVNIFNGKVGAEKLTTIISQTNAGDNAFYLTEVWREIIMFVIKQDKSDNALRVCDILDELRINTPSSVETSDDVDDSYDTDDEEVQVSKSKKYSMSSSTDSSSDDAPRRNQIKKVGQQSSYLPDSLSVSVYDEWLISLKNSKEINLNLISDILESDLFDEEIVMSFNVLKTQIKSFNGLVALLRNLIEVDTTDAVKEFIISMDTALFEKFVPLLYCVLYSKYKLDDELKMVLTELFINSPEYVNLLINNTTERGRFMTTFMAIIKEMDKEHKFIGRLIENINTTNQEQYEILVSELRCNINKLKSASMVDIRKLMVAQDTTPDTRNQLRLQRIEQRKNRRVKATVVVTPRSAPVVQKVVAPFDALVNEILMKYRGYKNKGKKETRNFNAIDRLIKGMATQVQSDGENILSAFKKTMEKNKDTTNMSQFKFFESQMLFKMLLITRKIDYLANITQLTYMWDSYKKLGIDTTIPLVSIIDQFVSGFNTDSIIKNLLVNDHLIHQYQKIDALPGQVEMFNELINEKPSLIMNLATTGSGKTEAIIAFLKIYSGITVYYCKHNNVMLEVGRKLNSLGIKPVIVRGCNYFSPENNITEAHLGVFIESCVQKSGFIPRTFIVADLPSFSKVLTNIQGKDMEITRHEGDVIKNIYYASAADNAVIFWDELDVDNTSLSVEQNKQGIQVVEIMKQLANYPKVVLSSATLPINVNSHLIIEWRQKYAVEPFIIDPPCNTLGISHLTFNNEYVTYHDNTSTMEELVLKLERIKSSSFLQKMYTGKIAIEMYKRLSKMKIPVVSPMQFFGNVINITLYGIRCYVFELLEAVSKTSDETVMQFCKRICADDAVNLDNVVRDAHKLLGTTLMPSLSSTTIPLQLTECKRTRVTVSDMFEVVRLDTKLTNYNPRGTTGQKAKMQANKDKLTNELKQACEKIEREVINGVYQLARIGLDNVDKSYVRELSKSDIIDISQLRTVTQNINQYQLAMLFGCVYYDGNPDSYSKKVLEQLSSSNPAKNPSFVSMKSCVGTNFPFSTVIIDDTYADNVSPSVLFQTISRVSRMGKNVLQGRAFLHPIAEAKLMQFFNEDEHEESRCIHELYEYVSQITTRDIINDTCNAGEDTGANVDFIDDLCDF